MVRDATRHERSREPSQLSRYHPNFRRYVSCGVLRSCTKGGDAFDVASAGAVRVVVAEPPGANRLNDMLRLLAQFVGEFRVKHPHHRAVVAWLATRFQFRTPAGVPNPIIGSNSRPPRLLH